MKKSFKALALGIAALGAVAGSTPMFAVDGDGTMSFTDEVTATVGNACGIYDAYTNSTTNTPIVTPKSYNVTLALGESAEINGTKAYVICNDTNGWDISAIGAGAGKTVDLMDASTGEDDDLASGTTFTGKAGMWAFKVGKGTNASALNIQSNYDSYKAVPTASTKVITSSAATDVATGEFTTGYKVYIGTETPAGTYIGKVTYTLTHPAGS